MAENSTEIEVGVMLSLFLVPIGFRVGLLYSWELPDLSRNSTT